MSSSSQRIDWRAEVFHPQWREASLARFDRDFDVVVIGGGITGCGVALDAAQRGLEVLLVERGDIASGTSSRSSKLIHGGLRYLKQMQFRITRLACRERDRMLSLSPHLVRPVRFLYPASEGDRTPGWQVDLGLWMYDRLTARPEKHSQLDLEETSRLVPDLPTEGLDRVLVYTDAMADDARLTLAVAATAHAYGAAVLTRCEAQTALRNAKVDGSPALKAWEDLYSPTVFFVGRSDDLTVIQYGNAITDQLDFLQQMAVQEDRLSGIPQFVQKVANLRPSNGIEPVGRFIQEQEIRIV